MGVHCIDNRDNRLFYGSSTRFIIFDQYANIVAQSQEEFPQYYPNPG